MNKMPFEMSDFEICDSDFDIAHRKCSADFEYSKSESKEIIAENVQQISDFQERMYANQKRSVLIVFQAMDAAGKDGTIERLLTGVNPQGVKVASFKAPNSLELRYDFLWRIQQQLPPRGIIGVFNRSHYEEVLVVRIHPSYLLPQNIPGITETKDVDNTLWLRRYDMIRNFEQRLVDTGTTVLKFFLHVSKTEQRKRLEARMNDSEKHWKFNLNDVKERPHWSAYMDAYNEAIKNTATPSAPWYIIPADDKNTMRAIVTTIVQKKLNDVKEDWPRASSQVTKEIEEARALFEDEL